MSNIHSIALAIWVESQPRQNTFLYLIFHIPLMEKSRMLTPGIFTQKNGREINTLPFSNFLFEN